MGKASPVVCFGDSLTFGTVGYSYIKFCKTKRKMINKGINGDTTTCMYQRLKKYIKNPRHCNTGTYIIAIGTNDLLLPYLEAVSLLWKIQMSPRVMMKKCIQDAEAFAHMYEQCINLILANKKQVVLVGLPYLELKGFSNHDMMERNAIIEQLAQKYQAPFVSVTDLQQYVCTQNTSFYSWKYKNLRRVLDAIVMLLLPFTKDIYSNIRNLKWTVDGVHFNSTIAETLGSAISQYL
ncbi:MAG TPA: GDSL-type esterase/lipase family protein [Lachnospiraceae bacterium]|nr:GDSL-type esterase/lipase family protein [Lachnospiraceae bacterium]